jgi:hypothetical protein
MKMVKTASDGEQREINDFSIRNANFEFEPCDIGLLLRYLLEDIHLHCSATVQKILHRRDEKTPSLDPKDIESGQLLQILQRHDWIVFMGPDTIDERASALWKRAFSVEELLSFPCSDQFLNEVKGLYGSHVALYFVWMQFFTRMLAAPGVLFRMSFLPSPFTFSLPIYCPWCVSISIAYFTFSFDFVNSTFIFKLPTFV